MQAGDSTQWTGWNLDRRAVEWSLIFPDDPREFYYFEGIDVQVIPADSHNLTIRINTLYVVAKPTTHKYFLGTQTLSHSGIFLTI
jgi:hypothetical protein